MKPIVYVGVPPVEPEDVFPPRPPLLPEDLLPLPPPLLLQPANAKAPTVASAIAVVTTFVRTVEPPEAVSWAASAHNVTATLDHRHSVAAVPFDGELHVVTKSQPRAPVLSDYRTNLVVRLVLRQHLD